LRLLADEFGWAPFEKSRDAFVKIFGGPRQALHAALKIELLLLRVFRTFLVKPVDEPERYGWPIREFLSKARRLPGLKCSTRRKPVQPIAVLPRREIEPAFAGTEKTPLIGETQHVGRLRKRQIEPAEILLRQFASCAV
jgi:hypothetical protein